MPDVIGKGSGKAQRGRGDPLYLQIKQALEAQISTGDYVTGGMLPTERELSEQYRVSRVTVRQALQELAKGDMVVHLPQKGMMVKAPSGSSPAVEPSARCIGYICAGISPRFSDPYYMGIMEGIYGMTVQNKYGSPIMYGADETGSTDYLFKQFKKNDIAGVVLSGGIPYTRLMEIQQAVKYVVLADNDWQVESCPRVTIDKAQGTYDLIRHLIGLGHRRIGFIGHVRDYEYAPLDEREHMKFGAWQHYIDGYRKALAEAGIEEDRRLIEHVISSAEQQELACWAVRKMLQANKDKDMPTAIFCTNDFIASKVLNSLNEIEFRIPEDIAVVAFDYMGLADYLIPKLTTVGVPRQQIGRLAASILIRWIEGKEPAEKEIVLPLNLIIRDSCGARIRMKKSFSEKKL